MAVETDRVQRTFLNVVAGTAISVDIPVQDASTVSVILGSSGASTVQGTDYSIVLSTDFSYFTITPLFPLRAKLDALVAAGEPDRIVVRRTLDFLSDMTASLAYFRQKIATEFDKTIMRFQQLEEKFSRCVTRSSADTSSTASLELPYSSGLAGKALIFDADGNLSASTDNYEDQAANAAASAAAAASSETNAANSASSASASQASASASEISAAASALAAQTSASSMLWRDIEFKTYADSPVTLTSADAGKLIAIDTSLGVVVVKLPSIAGIQLPFNVGVKKESQDGNAVTVQANGTDTIDGQASKTIRTPGAGATLVAEDSTAPDTWVAADFGAVSGNMTVDTFTGDGSTTTFALSVAPGSAANVRVVMGGVGQKPGADYSVSGSSLIFVSAPAIGVSGFSVTGTTLSIGVPADGTVTTGKIVDGNVTPSKLSPGAPSWDAGGNLTVPGRVSGVLPAVSAYSPSTQTIPGGVYTLVSFGVKTFDRAGNYDTASSKFVAPVAGVYEVNACASYVTVASGNSHTLNVYKNGSIYKGVDYMAGSASNVVFQMTIHALMYLAAGDYVQIYTSQDSGAAQTIMPIDFDVRYASA